MTMAYHLPLQITGLGILVYSPFAAAHIEEGTDFFSSHFNDPLAVARQVNAGRLAAFSTGSPGNFQLHVTVAPPLEQDVVEASFKIRLALEVRDSCLCFRDVYDLLSWEARCPPSQQIALASGFYRLTVLSSPPSSGILGDQQEVLVYCEPAAALPVVVWQGVPQLCGA